MVTRLPRSFYERSTLQVAQELLGKYLCHRLEDQVVLAGQIIEVEAYLGPQDRASHARFVTNRGGHLIPSRRSAIMFGPAGISYVYFVYGKHYCFNAIAHPPGEVGAILVRALTPDHPIKHKNCQGPARLCSALAIDQHANGLDLTLPAAEPNSCLWIEDRHVDLSISQIMITSRVGVAYAGPDAALPYRFLLNS